MRRCNAHDAPLVIRELRACENLAYYIQTFIYIHLLPMRKEKKEGSIYQKTCSYRNWKCFQLSFLFSRTLKKRKRNSFHKILLIAIYSIQKSFHFSKIPLNFCFQYFKFLQYWMVCDFFDFSYTYFSQIPLFWQQIKIISIFAVWKI